MKEEVGNNLFRPPGRLAEGLPGGYFNARLRSMSLLLSVPIAPPFFLSELPSGIGNVLLFGLLFWGVTLTLHKKYLPGALIVGLSLGVRLMAAFAR